MRQLSEQEIVRRQKLEEISKVCNPYPEKFIRTHELKKARLLEDGEKNVSIAGRIVFMRKMGKLSFIRIRDIEADMQLEIKIDLVGEEKYAFFKANFDVGDFIGATGEIFTTQTGEKTLRVESFEFLGKALRPLPEKFHGLQDMEIKYRQRYVDLITNEESRKVFLAKSKYYLFVRNFLNERGFLEVETPIIQTSVSGATAKPFFTHYNNIKVSQVTNLNSTIEKLKKNGFWIIGTDMQGEDYDKIDYKGKIGIIIGNEGHGMSKLVKESCDFIASIPMQGKVNSLNASVATAIVVFEAVKNRK